MTPTDLPFSLDTLWSNPKMQLILAIIGVVGFVISLVSSVMNQLIRLKTDRKEPVSTTLLAIASVLNVIAANFDKANQLMRMARGLPAASTKTDADAVDPAKPADPADPKPPAA